MKLQLYIPFYTLLRKDLKMDEKLNNVVVEETESKFAKEIGVFGGVSLLGGI